MLSIDGLATGINTGSIVESLLSIQQTQIDRFNERKQDVVSQQTAFKGLEAKLLALQGSIGDLTRVADNAFQQKLVTASDDTAVKAAVSDSAVEGVYRIRIDSLARSHQIASNAYATADAEIATGSFDLRVGEGATSTVSVDSSNNSLQGLMRSINDADLGITASIIDDGSPGDSFHLLLTARASGEANTISLAFTPAASAGDAAEISFDFENPVQAAANAKVFLGSGGGAIPVISSSNQFDSLFAGLTFEAVKADPATEIELHVVRDIETAETAITDFVGAYNDVVSYIQEQAKFDPETETASVLFGNRSVSSIRNALSQSVTSVVPGIDDAINRLSAIGVDITAEGTLTVSQSELTAVLNGQVAGVTLDNVLGLFSTQGQSDNQNIQFVLASDKTEASPVISKDGQSSLAAYGVRILQAAEKAQVRGAPITGPLVIDARNNELSLVFDGSKTATVTLADGTYEPPEFAAYLQQLLDNHQDLKHRPVTVAFADGAISITSQTYGKSSEVTIKPSTALATLGFEEDQTDRGLDVVGHFVVGDDKHIESAEGRGQILIGRARGEDNPGVTEGLQVRVTLTQSQVSEDISANITVTRGVASRLGLEIKAMTDPTGSLDRIEDEFAARIEAFDKSISRMNAIFDSRQQSLLAEFARLESSVGELQSVGNLLGVQLANLPRISV